MITVSVGGIDAYATTAENALQAAVTLLHDATVARRPGYISATFVDSDGHVIASLDGAAVAAIWKAEREVSA